MAVISGNRVLPGVRKRLSTPRDKGEGATAGGGVIWAKAIYDFSVEGGTVGAIGLLGSTAIPSGAHILGGYVNVVTPPDSAGHTATIAISVEGANDIIAAAAVSGAPWSTAGRKSIVPAFTGATAVVTTAARDITATIAVQNVTVGVFHVYLAYLAPSD